MRIYVYVDGESHFVRSQALWRRLHGDDAQLSEITSTLTVANKNAYPDRYNPKIRLEPRAKFFWDIGYQTIAPRPYTSLSIDGAAYFTSFSGDEDGYHAACVAVRAQRFDPQITRERAQLSDQRRRNLQQARQQNHDSGCRAVVRQQHDTVSSAYRRYRWRASNTSAHQVFRQLPQV